MKQSMCGRTTVPGISIMSAHAPRGGGGGGTLEYLEARDLLATFIVSNEYLCLVNQSETAEQGALDGQVGHERLAQLPSQLITERHAVHIPILLSDLRTSHGKFDSDRCGTLDRICSQQLNVFFSTLIVQASGSV